MLLFIGLGRTDRGDTLHCAGCGLFLGWAFEAAAGARPAWFCGLLEERLISRPGDTTSEA